MGTDNIMFLVQSIRPTNDFLLSNILNAIVESKINQVCFRGVQSTGT